MKSSPKHIDYAAAGVNIDAGNEAVERIKADVKSTHTPAVLTGLGGFGSLFDLTPLMKHYHHPVLVQSIDGVGTKVILAHKMKNYDTIGRDLLSACANDILVMGARPLTFLDYIANDRLDPTTVAAIVSGMAAACRETGVALVGGETAEMPDTYLPGEHDLVGIITGVVEKDRIITGEAITVGDVVLGLPSSGLHTNGYSLARKILFDLAHYNVNDRVEGWQKSIGETLLEPHINYTQPVLALLDADQPVHGMAHITGGGLVENIPRILSDGCAVELDSGAWPVPPVFSLLQSRGDLPAAEMYRVFNMGIGLIIIVPPQAVADVKEIVSPFLSVHEIGHVVAGDRSVHFIETGGRPDSHD